MDDTEMQAPPPNLNMAKAPFGPQPNAFAQPAQQLAFPAASINPGKADLVTALQKIQKAKEIAAYLNRPQQSQMGQLPLAGGNGQTPAT